VSDPNTSLHSKTMHICGMQPSAGTDLPMWAQLCVGFGVVSIERNGETEWHHLRCTKKGERTMRFAEKLARQAPDELWQVRFHSPMTSTLYTRTGRNQWTLVSSRAGFA